MQPAEKLFITDLARLPNHVLDRRKPLSCQIRSNLLP